MNPPHPEGCGGPDCGVFFKPFAHGVERGRLLRIGFDGGDAGKQPPGNRIVHGARGELAQAFHQVLAQRLAGRALARHADHAEFLRQQVCRGEIIESRGDQPMGQVAVHAEDDERAGIRPLPLGLCLCHGASRLRIGLLRLAVAAEAGLAEAVWTDAFLAPQPSAEAVALEASDLSLSQLWATPVRANPPSARVIAADA